MLPNIPLRIGRRSNSDADLAARNASILIRDRDSICTAALGRTVAAMGLTVLRTPLRSPQANAFCERVIGTTRCECVDWMIPLNELTSAACFGSGSHITIAGVHTLASD